MDWSVSPAQSSTYCTTGDNYRYGFLFGCKMEQQDILQHHVDCGHVHYPFIVKLRCACKCFVPMTTT